MNIQWNTPLDHVPEENWDFIPHVQPVIAGIGQLLTLQGFYNRMGPIKMARFVGQERFQMKSM